MISLVKILSSTVESGKRIVKFLRLGLRDVQTSFEAAPFGTDSNPIKNMVAVYMPTGIKGKTVLVGYINKNQLAGVGELRHYSTGEDGAVKFYTWLKNDGTYEVGGDADNMVRYSELESAFNDVKGKVNDLVTAFNSHTHVLTLSAGTGSAAPPANQQTPTTADISGAKIDEIKTL